MTAQLSFGQKVLRVGLVPFGLLLGYIVATGGPAPAIALLAIPGGAYLVMRHRMNGLLCGIVLMGAYPYWSTFASPQAASFRLAALLALVTCLFPYRTRLTAVDLAVLLLALVAIFGWILQDDQPGVGKIVLNELLPFAFYVGARTLPSDRVTRAMAVAFGAGTIGALTVFYETAVGHVVFADPSSYTWNATDATIFRAGGIFGSPPGAATVLALTALLGLPMLRLLRGRRLLLARVCFALTAAACVSTFTRASIIGLFAGLIVYLWLSRSPLLDPRRLFFATAAVAILVVFLLPMLQGGQLYERGVIRPGNLAARESIWRLAIPIATANPHNALFGIGSEATLAARQGANVPAGLAGSPVLVVNGTHNQYVLALLEQGLLGLGVLIAWLGTTIYMGVRGTRPEADPVSAALTGSVVAFATVMLANNALLHPPSLAFAALATGLLVARKQNHSDDHTLGGFKWSSQHRLFLVNIGDR